jgi:hypothetical protein
MRRVLQLKAVTQCAMLESFGIFLVLADKVRLSSEFLRLKLAEPFPSPYSHTTSKLWFRHHLIQTTPT